GPMFVMPFVPGAKGTEWAWRNKRWESHEAFRRTQRAWGWAGLAIFVVGVVGGLAAVGLVAAHDGVSTGPTVGAANPSGFVLRTDRADGFALAVPREWNVQPAASSGGVVKFLAVGNVAGRGSPSAAVAVSEEPLRGLANLESYLQANLRSLAANPS